MQSHALANAVIAYAENCDNLGVLGSAVNMMVHKHVSFEIMPEHYPIVGESIIQAIKEVLGDAATDEVIQGWSEAYQFLADLLIEAEKNLREELAAKDGKNNKYGVMQRKISTPFSSLLSSSLSLSLVLAMLPTF